MLVLNAASLLMPVLAVMTVMKTPGWDGVSAAAKAKKTAKKTASKTANITEDQIYELINEGKCPLTNLNVNQAKVNETWVGESTMLHWAAYNGSTKFVRVLLQAGANKFAVDGNGMIPLHSAAHGGSADVVAQLLEDGDADQQRMSITHGWRIPLHFAVLHDNSAIVRLLIQKATCSNPHLRDQLSATDQHHRTAPYYALFVGNTRIDIAAEIIVRAGCPPNPAFIALMFQDQNDAETVAEMTNVIKELSQARCQKVKAKN